MKSNIGKINSLFQARVVLNDGSLQNCMVSFHFTNPEKSHKLINVYFAPFCSLVFGAVGVRVGTVSPESAQRGRALILAGVTILVFGGRSGGLIHDAILRSVLTGERSHKAILCILIGNQAVEKRTSLDIFWWCAADSQTKAGRHQLYNNGSFVLFSTIYW